MWFTGLSTDMRNLLAFHPNLNCVKNDPRIYRDTPSSFPFSVALCVGFHHPKSRIADFASDNNELLIMQGG
jgi:hypothetical protein